MSAIDRAVEKAGSQAKLAELLDVTQGLISQWVNGADIHTKYFAAIENATGVTAHELLEDELAKHPTPKPRRKTVAHQDV